MDKKVKQAQKIIASDNFTSYGNNPYIVEVINAIKKGYRLVNMNFNTDSATSCYTAIQEAIKGGE